jgi:hypothetical protein
MSHILMDHYKPKVVDSTHKSLGTNLSVRFDAVFILPIPIGRNAQVEPHLGTLIVSFLFFFLGKKSLLSPRSRDGTSLQEQIMMEKGAGMIPTAREDTFPQLCGKPERPARLVHDPKGWLQGQLKKGHLPAVVDRFLHKLCPRKQIGSTLC